MYGPHLPDSERCSVIGSYLACPWTVTIHPNWELPK